MVEFGSPSFDVVYGLGMGKTMIPSRLGFVGINRLFTRAFPVLGASSPARLVFCHDGVQIGFYHQVIMVPSMQASIVVLTNTTSKGNIASWVAQLLLQAVLDLYPKVNFLPFAIACAEGWTRRYHDIGKHLRQKRIPDTPSRPVRDYLGEFVHETGKITARITEKPDGELQLSWNNRPLQMHSLKHYHYDTFCFFTSHDDLLKRGLITFRHPEAFLLHFVRNENGLVCGMIWKVDQLNRDGEKFTRLFEEHGAKL